MYRACVRREYLSAERNPAHHQEFIYGDDDSRGPKLEAHIGMALTGAYSGICLM